MASSQIETTNCPPADQSSDLSHRRPFGRPLRYTRKRGSVRDIRQAERRSPKPRRFEALPIVGNSQSESPQKNRAKSLRAYSICCNGIPSLDAYIVSQKLCKQKPLSAPRVWRHREFPSSSFRYARVVDLSILLPAVDASGLQAPRMRDLDRLFEVSLHV